MVVTSDATDAYKLVQPSVDLVQRTLVFVKPDILVFLDRIKLNSPSKVQVRFQIYNEDNKGKGEAGGSGFTIQRPNASLQASVRATSKVSFRSGQHNVPADIGIYPYVEVESEQDMTHEIMTVCIASGPKKEQSEVAITKKENTWTAAGKHAGKKFKVSVSVGGEKPVVEVDLPG
jgi:YbbR domain-containing protein